MPDVRVVSINDRESEVRSFRARVAASLANLEYLLTQEVTRINAEQKALREDVEKLKQGGGPPELSG